MSESHQAATNGGQDIRGWLMFWKENANGNQARRLSRDLKWWHITMIAMSGTLGLGIFEDTTKVLQVAGALAVMVAFAIVGLVVMFTLDGVAEMTAQWPVPNAYSQYVAAFVEKRLGTVVGYVYWYANGAVFASLTDQFALLAEAYWSITYVGYRVALRVSSAALVLLLSFLPVKVFGFLETFGGAIKVVFLIGIFIGTMMDIDTVPDDWMKNDGSVSGNSGVATLSTLIQATFAFVGVDLFVVSAVEESTADSTQYIADGSQLARDQHDRTLPGKFIPLAVFVLYTFCGFISAFPVQHGDELYGLLQNSFDCNHAWKTPALVVAAKFRRVSDGDPQQSFGSTFLTVFLMYAAFSAAFTTLYAASRTLFGLNRHLRDPRRARDEDRSFLDKVKQLLKLLRYRTGRTTSAQVPAWAAFVTVIFFSWLSFVSLTSPCKATKIQTFVFTSGTTGIFFVWMVTCFAYIRYRLWVSKLAAKDNLTRDNLKYDHSRRDNEAVEFRSLFYRWQPFIAMFGCFCTALIAFVLSTAVFWEEADNSWQAFPIFCWLVLALIFTLPCFRGAPWVQISGDNNDDFERIVSGFRQAAFHGTALSRPPSGMLSHQALQGTTNANGIPLEAARQRFTGRAHEDTTDEYKSLGC